MKSGSAAALAGQRGHVTGLAAEAQVLRHYLKQGVKVVAQRWRGQGGEIDIIARDEQGFVFVEVKASRDITTAAGRLTRRQMQRLMVAAEEFLTTVSGGLGNHLRFDVALVDRQGRLEIIENALIDC